MFINKEEKEANALFVKMICKNRNFNYNIEVHYSDDINKDILKYVYREKTTKEYAKIDFSGLNGVALPYEENGYHIIINNKLYNGITTIIHETIHIIDFYEFRNIYNDGNIDIETHPYYWAFYLYTEFNARFCAHKFYLLYILDEVYDKDIEIEELSRIIKEFYASKGDSLTIEDFYNLMQYLGRWYSIEDVCKREYDLPYYSDLYKILVDYEKKHNEENLKLLSSMFG